jgi:hypothetical protein
MKTEDNQTMHAPIIGPFTMDISVHVQSEDGRKRGAVTVGLTPGVVPTLEHIHSAIRKALRSLPAGYALMTPDNFVTELVQEKTGSRGSWCAPKNMQYDVAALTQSVMNESS